MGITVMTASAIIAFATLSLMTRDTQVAAAVPSNPSSPILEAERILAGRYAAGEITSESYERMLTIIRT